VTDGLLRVGFCSSCIASVCSKRGRPREAREDGCSHGPLTGPFGPDDHLLEEPPSNCQTREIRQKLEFLFCVRFSGSSYHARMRPASTKSNAIPRESHWEKRNDVDRKFISWKQKYMRRTTKTRNLERIQKNKELGICSCRKLQKSSEKLDAIYQQLTRDLSS